MGAVIAIQIHHMIFRMPNWDVGRRHMMAAERQGTRAVMIDTRVALSMAVILGFRSPGILQTVYGPRADRSMMAGLPLQDVGTATVALCLPKSWVPPAEQCYCRAQCALRSRRTQRFMSWGRVPS